MLKWHNSRQLLVRFSDKTVVVITNVQNLGIFCLDVLKLSMSLKAVVLKTAENGIAEYHPSVSCTYVCRVRRAYF